MTEPIQIQQIARVVDGQLLYGPLHPVYTTGFSIDTRTMNKGDVFIAIKGRHFNGNDFVEKAFLKGACCAIVSRARWQRGSRLQTELGPGPLIAVSDTTAALTKIAHFWRRKLNAVVIAVTGSIGKSTAREFIYNVLSRAGKASRSIHNYNNIYGLPLSILRIKRDCEYLVLEIAMSAPGEIAQLVRLCKPKLGAVTNVATCHTQFFSSLDDVADAKAEMFGLLPSSGALFLNADDERLVKRSGLARCPVISFGLSDGDFKATQIRALGGDGTAFDLVHDGETFPLRCPLLGAHNVYNALVAAAVGRHLGLSWEEIAEGLLQTAPLPHRLNMLSSADGRLRILDDSYNSSPAAVRAAIDALAALRKSAGSQAPTILVLADMLELGDVAKSEHYKVGIHVGQSDVDSLYLLGPLSVHIGQGARDAGMAQEAIQHFESIDQLRNRLLETRGRAWILVKGSRLWRLERLVERLCSSPNEEVEAYRDTLPTDESAEKELKVD